MERQDNGGGRGGGGYMWSGYCTSGNIHTSFISCYSHSIPEHEIKMHFNYTDWVYKLSMKLQCVFNSIIRPEVHWCERLTVYFIPDIQYCKVNTSSWVGKYVLNAMLTI